MSDNYTSNPFPQRKALPRQAYASRGRKSGKNLNLNISDFSGVEEAALRDICNHKILSPSEELDLIEKITTYRNNAYENVASDIRFTNDMMSLAKNAGLGKLLKYQITPWFRDSARVNEEGNDFYRQMQSLLCKKKPNQDNVKELTLETIKKWKPNDYFFDQVVQQLDKTNRQPDGRIATDIYEWENTIVEKAELFYHSAELLEVHNYRFVAKIAMDDFKYALQNKEILMWDLVANGITGLRIASLRVDSKYDNKFSTYAANEIQAKMRRYLKNTKSTVRVPIHEQTKKALIKNTEASLGLNATPEKISEETGFPLKYVEYILGGSGTVISLDSTVSTMDDSPKSDFFPDPNASIPGEYNKFAERHEKIEELLAILPNERWTDILRSRYGLDGKGPQTLEIIGERYGVTRERIRQIESDALKWLRHPTRKEFLDKYVL